MKTKVRQLESGLIEVAVFDDENDEKPICTTCFLRQGKLEFVSVKYKDEQEKVYRVGKKE